jgi:glycosyltransferase involved in cell wall biosynthesis
MKKITYVFGGGRLDKLSKEREYSKDFYYGYHLVKNNNNFETKILELYPFSNTEESTSKVLLALDKLLNKLTFLQFYFHEIFKTNNYKEIKNSNILIFSTDRLAISFFPILKLKKNLKSIVIVMGLLKEHPNIKFYQKILRPYILYLFIKSVDKLIFLGKPEFDFAKNKYPKFVDKFEFVPFCIDHTFWSKDEFIENDSSSSNQILFVGNDGNRNYKFVEALPGYLENFKFKFVTEQIVNSKKFSNLDLINGNWSKGVVNDIKMRSFYKESFLTILPIKNTIQPSGQSVTLQSLATGTPILISNFDGFWDSSLFVDNKNIFFIDSFNIDEWKVKIEEIYKDQKKLKSVSKEGKKLVISKYNLEIFTKKMIGIIEDII